MLAWRVAVLFRHKYNKTAVKFPQFLQEIAEMFPQDGSKVRLNQPIKLRHRTRLDGIHDVYVGLHGLVVRVAGPFHHDVRGDAEG